MSAFGWQALNFYAVHADMVWCHMQAGAGLVADSVPESEYEETVNKAAALGRAIDLAEQAFVDC
jgi:anthranilate/para-aminobenzoate synthase component I